MSKRDYIKEILEIRERIGKRPAFLGAFLRLLDIKYMITNNNDNYSEIYRYCPVGLVACIESYFREVVKELIDSGNPYFERASQLNIEKYDFNIVSAIQGQIVTLGDIISHLISINNINDINKTMCKLLDEDFFKVLKNVEEHYPWKSRSSRSNKRVISDINVIINDLKKIFEIRHIICHEFAFQIKISKEEAISFIDSVELFLSATNFLITEILFKEIPDTQYERNIYFNEKYKTANKQMEKLLDDAKSIFDQERLSNFKKLQSVWESYRDNDAKFVADYYKGGTIQPQVLSQRLLYLTEKRTIEIKRIFEIFNDY